MWGFTSSSNEQNQSTLITTETISTRKLKVRSEHYQQEITRSEYRVYILYISVDNLQIT